MTTPPLPRWGGNRRRFVASAAGLGTAGLGLRATAFAQATPGATPVAATPIVGGDQHLLVADPAVSTVYVYSIPDLRLTGQLDGVLFGVHNGALVLEDGRILFSDDATRELLAVTIDVAGVPSVAQRVAINSGNRLVWSSVDPDFTYYVGASQIPDSSTQVLNVVDLASFTNAEFAFEMLEEEELHAWLSGDPLTVYVSVGGQVDSYQLSHLMAGNQEPVASIQVEPGSHGAVADSAHDQFVLVTNTGLDVMDVAGGPAEYLANIPWDVDGFAGGRNARPRLHPDATHVFGRLSAPPETPEQWAEVEVTTHAGNVADHTARRFALGTGNVSGRWGISEPYVLFAGHDGVSGTAYLVSADSGEDTFGSVLASIPLDVPGNAATPGEDPTGGEGYLTTLTRDGALGFVVHGGDGVISVIDTASEAVVSTIEVPSPMTGSGYATVVESGVAPVDLFGR